MLIPWTFASPGRHQQSHWIFVRNLSLSFIMNDFNTLLINFSYLFPGYNLVWHDDVIKWKLFARYWPFVRGIHRSPVNSLHKGQWRGALMFSIICAWLNGWVNTREAGDLRRHHAHHDVIVMTSVNPHPNLCPWCRSFDRRDWGCGHSVPSIRRHPWMWWPCWLRRLFHGAATEEATGIRELNNKSRKYSQMN